MFTVRSHDPRTLLWWYGERDQIEMNPPYQRRGGLWTAGDKSYLIDSILNGFDVPKIYLADFTYKDTPLNETRKIYAVIDGKQRMEAIFDFLSGNFTLAEDFEYFENRSIRLGGLSYKDLRDSYPRVASKFENYHLTVMSVITDDEAKINELFVRLNKSKPLTGAEIRNAMAGEVPKLIRQIAQHRFFTDFVKFQTNRGQDLNTAAKVLLVEFRGKFVDVKKSQLDGLVVEAAEEAETETVDRAAERAVKTLDAMCEVFNPRDQLLGAQGRLLIYYWLVRNVASKHRHAVREFLVQFERQVVENRALAKDGGQNADDELLSFDYLNRNTNDAGSLIARYSILVRRFAAFRRAPASEVAPE